MYRTAARLTVLVGTALLMVACANPIRIESDYDPTARFAAYQTYSFISERPLVVADAQLVNPLLEGRLVRATRSELSAKGYRFVENPAEADFVVSFTVGARDKIKVTHYPAPYQGRWGRRWGGAYFEQVDVRNYTQGTLAIDLFDVADKHPVWHGFATKTLNSQDQREPESTVNAAVAAIMAEFPPQ